MGEGVKSVIDAYLCCGASYAPVCVAYSHLKRFLINVAGIINVSLAIVIVLFIVLITIIIVNIIIKVRITAIASANTRSTC